MNVIDAIKKVVFSIMKNVSIHADNERLQVSYDNGEVSHSLNVEPNEAGQPCVRTEINADSETPCDNYKETDYRVLGSAVTNFSNVFGSVYAVCLIGNLGCNEYDSLPAHDRVSKLYEAFGGAASEIHISSTFIPDADSKIDTMINKISDNAYILIRIMRPTAFNTMGTERISCVGDVLRYLEKISDINMSELLPHLNGVMCNALVLEVEQHWKGFAEVISNSMNDADLYTDAILSSTGQDIAETIANDLLSVELLSIGECMKNSCGLEYIPEVPICSHRDSSKFNRFKKKYPKFFDCDISGYAKLAMVPNLTSKKGE